MEFLVGMMVLGVPVAVGWIVFWKRMEMQDSHIRPYREGEVRPWETEADERAERRRINAMLEDEFMSRAA